MEGIIDELDEIGLQSIPGSLYNDNIMMTGDIFEKIIVDKDVDVVV